MTDQPQPRKHLAKRWWGKNGLIIRCTCGQWESRRGDTRRQQDDAHRAHRIDMGETVRPRKLTRVEQMEAEIDRLTAALATMTAVAENNKRYVQSMYQDLRQAQQQTAESIAKRIEQTPITVDGGTYPMQTARAADEALAHAAQIARDYPAAVSGA